MKSGEQCFKLHGLQTALLALMTELREGGPRRRHSHIGAAGGCWNLNLNAGAKPIQIQIFCYTFSHFWKVRTRMAQLPRHPSTHPLDPGTLTLCGARRSNTILIAVGPWGARLSTWGKLVRLCTSNGEGIKRCFALRIPSNVVSPWNLVT